jgi:DNA-binding GntR family transcriptional regulator
VSGQAVLEYQRAADVIKSRIEPGSIGSVITIRQIQGLARTTYSTARTAAGHLEAEGILRPRQGKGYEVIATPEKAAADRADAKELSTRLAQLENQVQALADRPGVPADLRETLERIEFNLQALYGKLGIPYPGDGASEREDSKPAARRGRTG